jgi:hypothetical protein
MAARGNNPHVPSQEIAESLKKEPTSASVAKKEHHDANPGIQILDGETAAKLETPQVGHY